MIPAEHASARLEVGILPQQRRELGRQPLFELGRDDLVQVVVDPAQRALGNQPGREETLADRLVDVAQLRVRVDHGYAYMPRIFVTVATRLIGTM